MYSCTRPSTTSTDVSAESSPADSPDGTMIVLANFLLETKESGKAADEVDFPQWLLQHREIHNVLSRKTLE